jgi:hypothetical protein
VVYIMGTSIRKTNESMGRCPRPEWSGDGSDSGRSIMDQAGE